MAKSVLHIIEDSMSTFSKGQKRIGRYILEHYDQAAFMTASKLGKLTEVSESTVVRFAAELGYDGYPSMQKALQEMARSRLTSTQRIQAAESIYGQDVLSGVLQADIENLRQVALNEDRRTFDTAVNRIVGARHIYILGARSSTHLAGYLHFYMQMIFENVTLVQSTAAGEIFEQLFRCGEGDVMIALSFPRYSKDTINAVRFAKSRGVEIVGHHGSGAVPCGADVGGGASGAQRDAVFYRLHDGPSVPHQRAAGGDRHEDGNRCNGDIFHAGKPVGSIRSIWRCG